jgi:hypothetical protein
LADFLIFLKERTKEKFSNSLKLSQKPPFLLPTFRASALLIFKKETIGGKTLKKCLKIDICDNL